MLSRVAESIYWLSRYIERAENVARFIDVNLTLMLDMPAGTAEQWDPLVEVTGDMETYKKKYGEAARDQVIRFLAFDREYPNSIASCLRSARENARSIREIISSEMWEQLNGFYLMVREASQVSSYDIDTAIDFCTRVKMASHLFAGISDNTMSHNEAWHFRRMGQLIERADKTSRILDVKYFYLLPSVHDVGSPLDEVQWAAVLRSASALEMYRKKYGRISPDHIAEFLVLDREFPRAIHYCVGKAEESLHAITGSPAGTFRNSAEQRLGMLRAELAYTTTPDILKYGLHEFLDTFQDKLNKAGNAIFDTYFALRPLPEAVNS